MPPHRNDKDGQDQVWDSPWKQDSVWIIKALQKSKSVRYSRSIGYHTATVSAKFSGIKVSLFFYRRGRNGNWNALLTSDLKLDAKEAFRPYSRRRVIEVATRR